MPARHRSRQRALQVLFLWDLRKQSIDEALASFYETLGSEEEDPQPTPPDQFMEDLVRGASEQSAEIDQRISAKSEHWRLERLAVIDRLILRMAAWELQNAADTPPAVVLNEALELARTFSTDDSVRFVNGVLDAIRKSLAD